MSKIVCGYGSQWHLLRFLGYHRDYLNSLIKSATGAHTVKWLDFPFNTNAAYFDSEWKAVDFLPENHPARSAWLRYWPQNGNPQNWDAVAVLHYKNSFEWLLVEAKAHIGELISHCQAEEDGGLPMIRAAIDETKMTMGVEESANWLSPYYQYANRLAIFNFLIKNGVPTRLLFLYFVGDHIPGKECPSIANEWKPALDNVYSHLGLTGNSQLETMVHHLSVNVVPTEDI